MKRLNKGIWVLITTLALLGAGCIVHDHHGDGGCGNDCGGSNPGWYMLTPDTDLAVGQACPVTCLPDLCTGYLDTDVYYDTISLYSADYGLDDIHLNYAVENQGNDPTNITISLCDDLGCEEVAYLPALQPGEYFQDSIDSAVLQTAMDDYLDCMHYYGDVCFLDYDVDVYVDEDQTCTAVAFDYYFEGYYLF